MPSWCVRFALSCFSVITLSNGKPNFVRPDTEAPLAWVYQPKQFTFTHKRRSVTFGEDEVLAAREAGDPEGVNEIKYGSSLAGKPQCGRSQTEVCPGKWVERLWANCGKDEHGKCVKPGQLDQAGRREGGVALRLDQ